MGAEWWVEKVVGDAGAFGNGKWDDKVMYSHFHEMLACIAGVIANPQPNVVAHINL